MINNILILDTETTGLHPKDSLLIEVGAICYNMPSQSIIYEQVTLLKADKNPVEHINHISVESLQQVDEFISHYILKTIAKLMDESDIIIAHNAKFDRMWIESDVILKPHSLISKWVCSVNNINWYKTTSGKKLQDIAGHFGIDYTQAHRALADCHILLKCLKKLPDLSEQLNKYS